MTVAVVTLAIALAAALGTIGYLAYRLQQVAPDLVAAGKARLAAEESAETYREERDDAVFQLAAARAVEQDALARLKSAEQQRNEALEKAAHATAEAIRNAPTSGAALDELDRELRRQQDALSGVAGATGADRSRDR